MKKNTNITDINKLTRNIDKQLMQMLAADLNNYKYGKAQPGQSIQRNKQAA